jgi:hypothetical protein
LQDGRPLFQALVREHMWPRFDGAAAWAKLTPEQQREIGAAALEFVQARCGHHLYTVGRTDIEEAAHLFEIAKEMLGTVS